MTFEEWFAKEFAGVNLGNYRDNPIVEDVARRAWLAATERAAKVATEAAKRNLNCPEGCRCADGWHIAASIREDRDREQGR